MTLDRRAVIIISRHKEKKLDVAHKEEQTAQLFHLQNEGLFILNTLYIERLI